MCSAAQKSRSSAHLILALLTVALSAYRVDAQSPATRSQPPSELPNEVRAALKQIEDFSFGFSQAGFYAVLEYMKQTNTPPGQTRAPIKIDDWAVLLERPADFRGLPITIEGIVGRNSAWRFEQAEHRELGTVWQLELWRKDQPIAATLILTTDASDIPVGATIGVTGYFVMVRQYYSTTKQVRQAALLVAHGPTLVSQSAPRSSVQRPSKSLVGLLVTITVALLAGWLLLRRSVSRSRYATGTLRATGPAPISLSDELAAWAAEQPQQPPDTTADAETGGSPEEGEQSDAGGGATRP